MAFSADSALNPNVQLLTGNILELRDGRWIAPATGDYIDGWLYRKNADGETLETCGSNDASYIGEQPVGSGPIADAANREKYTQGIPQNVAGNGTRMTVWPIGAGLTIKTNNVWDGTATGAITTSTAVNTEVECYNGKWRELQGGNSPIGKIVVGMDSNGFLEIMMY